MLLFSQIMNEYPALVYPLTSPDIGFRKRLTSPVILMINEVGMPYKGDLMNKKEDQQMLAPFRYFLFDCSSSGTALFIPSVKKLMTTIAKKTIPAIRETRVSSLIHIPMSTMMRKAMVK